VVLLWRSGKDGIMWTRAFGKEHASLYDRLKVCNQLKGTLLMLGVEQMVVGHTPQVFPTCFSSTTLEAMSCSNHIQQLKLFHLPQLIGPVSLHIRFSLHTTACSCSPCDPHSIMFLRR
jgi:hypothetical protein